MAGNPFSIESILQKQTPFQSVSEDAEEPQSSRSSEALSLAVKLAGKYDIDA